MTAEEQRTRLIGEIASVLRDGPVPEDARAAALTLIGWLARRMPGEPVSFCELTRCTGNGIARLDDGPPSSRRRARSPRGSR
jgi:glucose-6-phosphate dehydrogenase assembly protein OpcA